MPTPEEIKEIARRFELDMYPTMPDMLSVKAMLEWLSKNYCIVEKSRIKEEYKSNVGCGIIATHTHEGDLIEFFKGRAEQLEDLFGKELFNEE